MTHFLDPAHLNVLPSPSVLVPSATSAQRSMVLTIAPTLSPVDTSYACLAATTSSRNLRRASLLPVLSVAGWSTPRGETIEAHDCIGDSMNEDDILLFNPGTLKTRAEARRLEYKVAKVAAKKCSLEEVTTLQKELQDWLQSDVKRDDQSASLQLSAALLRAIIVNHLAHKQATEMAKTVEANLKEKLDEVEAAKEQLESELRRMVCFSAISAIVCALLTDLNPQSTQYAAKAQEVQTLRAELSRLKVRGAAPGLGIPAAPPPSTSSTSSVLTSPPRPQSAVPVTSSRSGATSPTSSMRTSYVPSVLSPVSRASAASGHIRSASTVPGYRTMTPAARPASAIPSSTHVSSTGGEAGRHIPTSSSRQPRVSSPPLPPKMSRTTSSGSDEKEKEKQREKDRQRVQLIQRWIPSLDAAGSPPSGRPGGFHSMYSASSTTTTTTASMPPPARYKTPLSANSP
ncbi:uncharacterized protein FIBRA_04794 [Fibroporia radiculosa]|uniref:Uncharacterized protein n=1 Tax=Fibroporia radiculosa TaxID=599839 RepID=J4G7Z0_9APHY|nr:uncharacterized protein FIBRA_04794 [Fibroporia radiculosa]CCM02688.1 predicted protein [Fibroporia radiculosa]